MLRPLRSASIFVFKVFTSTVVSETLSPPFASCALERGSWQRTVSLSRAGNRDGSSSTSVEVSLLQRLRSSGGNATNAISSEFRVGRMGDEEVERSTGHELASIYSGAKIQVRIVIVVASHTQSLGNEKLKVYFLPLEALA